MIRGPRPSECDGQKRADAGRSGYSERTGAGLIAAAACSAAVDDFAAVGHAVAAGAGGVVAAANTARVNFLTAIRYTITSHTRCTVTITNATLVSDLAAIGNTITTHAGTDIDHRSDSQGFIPCVFATEIQGQTIQTCCGSCHNQRHADTLWLQQ